jgi:hypothetical protein
MGCYRRHVLNSVLIDNECVLNSILIDNECIHSRIESGDLGVLCKLDLKKAYDHVNWGFLLYMLRRYGFWEKW